MEIEFLKDNKWKIGMEIKKFKKGEHADIPDEIAQEMIDKKYGIPYHDIEKEDAVLKEEEQEKEEKKEEEERKKKEKEEAKRKKKEAHHNKNKQEDDSIHTHKNKHEKEKEKD